jgi:hypothetical protein
LSVHQVNAAFYGASSIRAYEAWQAGASLFALYLLSLAGDDRPVDR